MTRAPLVGSQPIRVNNFFQNNALHHNLLIHLWLVYYSVVYVEREDSNWCVVLKGLVEDKKVEKYLKPYALRHSFITRLVREGIDIKTVATLSGNSVQTIIKHYLAAKQDFDLPEL